MRSSGRILREEREKRGLSLDELVKRTRISRKSIEALEQDDASALGSAFYFRSFANQIASALELDRNAKEWREALGSIPEVSLPRRPASSESYVPRVAPLRARRQGAWRSASPVLSFVAVLIACSGLYTVFDRVDFSPLHSMQETAASFKGPWSGTETGPQETAAPQAAKSAEAISLKIAAVEKTWLSVDTDGKHIYSGLLDASDTKELEGRSTARIRTGNAGGLTVTFNGKDLGTLGERGQVRTVVFTPDQYRILGPSLTSRLQLLPAMSFPRWR